jgi:hypothetical protein
MGGKTAMKRCVVVCAGEYGPIAFKPLTMIMLFAVMVGLGLL